MSSCSTRGLRRHVFFSNKKTCLLAEQEDMSRQVFLLNRKEDMLLNKTTPQDKGINHKSTSDKFTSQPGNQLTNQPGNQQTS